MTEKLLTGTLNINIKHKTENYICMYSYIHGRGDAMVSTSARNAGDQLFETRLRYTCKKVRWHPDKFQVNILVGEILCFNFYM